MQKKIVRGIISIISIIVLAFIGIWGLLMVLFSIDRPLYTILILSAFFLSIILLGVWTFKVIKSKTLLYSFLSIILFSTLIVVGKGLYNNYINSIPTVDEQSLYLTEYEPFADSTKAIFLPQESTLRLQDNLPKINGATALYPLYAAFVQATYPKDDYPLFGSIIKGNTTPEAFNDLIAGEVDVIFCATPSKSQVEQAKKYGIEFRLTPIGREAFVFFVNKKNSINNLSLSQIQDIYSGEIINWKEVGGKNQEIKAFQRPQNSGSQTMLEKIMEDRPLMAAPVENQVEGMGGIIEQTATYRNFDNAIGYSFLFFVTGMVKNDNIKLLKINGIEPNKTTIESYEYPFVGDFYAITTNKLTNTNVEELINWILSPQGQYLVEKTGYISIKNNI